MSPFLKKQFACNVGISRIHRVMKDFHLQAITRQIRKAKPCSKKGNHAQLPNLLNRDFSAQQPFHRMVTDVTYIRYFEKGEWHWGYLSLVQDLFDRSIVAWVFSRKQNNQLGRRTLFLLSLNPLAKGALLHSDRGSIYTGDAFRTQASLMGLTQSFSRAGNCHDNATMECFNGTLKAEALHNPLVATVERPSFEQQNALINEYIQFYNERRPCSVIANLTPVECRNKYFSEDAMN